MAMAAVSAAAVCSGPRVSSPSSYPWETILRWKCRSSAISKAFIDSHGKQQLRLAAARRQSYARASSQQKTGVEFQLEEQEESKSGNGDQEPTKSASAQSPNIQKELNKAVTKTAATFAPRASTASKNPAVPGSTLYQVFEVQAYIAMAVGGFLSYNLLLPSDQADIWRLMGMWSIWMFTIPSLRARDCSKTEKEALNYLFLLIPLINVALPIFWKSFAAVWSADVVAFFAMYAWKMEWLSGMNKKDE